MLDRIHRKLGTAGFIISILALVAALGGGAYAASGGLNGKQKKEVEKIAKKFSGKPGAAGATGPSGAAGKDGSNGSNGTAGTAGTAGKNGTNGTNGSPWTAGGVLPSGSTETGAWSIQSTADEVTAETAAVTSISFPVPLSAALDSEHVFYVPTTGPESPEAEVACTGSVEAPAAAKGDLCVYEGFLQAGLALSGRPITELNATTEGASTAGAILGFEVTQPSVSGRGSWSVTAP
jgi:hypothetical protein